MDETQKENIPPESSNEVIPATSEDDEDSEEEDLFFRRGRPHKVPQDLRSSDEEEPMDTIMSRGVGGGPAPPPPPPVAAPAGGTPSAPPPSSVAAAAAAAATPGPRSAGAAAAVAAVVDAVAAVTPTTLRRPPQPSGNAPLRARHHAAADSLQPPQAELGADMEVLMNKALSDVENASISMIQKNLGDKVLLWNAANVRRNVRAFGMWPVCHLIDNKLLIGVNKNANGENPNVLFFLKNDSVPLEHNDTAIPLSPSGFNILSQTAPKIRDWVFEVDKMQQLMKLQGTTKLSTQQFQQLMHSKPADVFLEDSIRLPGVTGAANLKNKALLAGAAGSVKLSCFLNQKFDVCGTAVLRFSQCVDESPDERTLFIPGHSFALLVDGAIPFIKQCNAILESVAFELQREYGMGDYF